MLDKVIRFLVELHMKRAGGKTAATAFYTYLLKRSLEGLNFGESDMIINGEDANLSRLIADSKHEDFVMFDVGANVGDYSQAAIAKCQGKTLDLHCFEPSKDHFKILSESLKHDKLHLNNFGLSDQAGTLTLFKDKTVSGLASLYKRDVERHNIHMDLTEEVKLRTLDEYCAEHAIKRIDFVKIDVEGHELKVLQGATAALKAGVIKSLQFEFGECCIDSRVFFKDIHDILIANNYSIYRIAKDGLVKVEKYSGHHELYVFCNYCAIFNGDR